MMYAVAFTGKEDLRRVEVRYKTFNQDYTVQGSKMIISDEDNLECLETLANKIHIKYKIKKLKNGKTN